MLLDLSLRGIYVATRKLPAVGDEIVADERVDHVLLPIRDGVTLACVR